MRRPDRVDFVFVKRGVWPGFNLLSCELGHLPLREYHLATIFHRFYYPYIPYGATTFISSQPRIYFIVGYRLCMYFLILPVSIGFYKGNEP